MAGTFNAPKILTAVLPLMHVMLGVALDLSKEPHRNVFEVEKPINITGEEHRWLCFLHHCFDPSMAPPGKSTAEVWYATRYEACRVCLASTWSVSGPCRSPAL